MSSYKNILWWPLAYVVGMLVLFQTDFMSGSHDSMFYNRIAEQMYHKPMNQWIAPLWGENFYGNPPQSYIQDHLAFHPMQGALLAKFGIPIQHALHALEIAYMLLCIHLLYLISREFISARRASVLFWSLLLVPLAFTYRIRANHEQGMMFFTLLGVYAGLRLPRSWIYILISTIATLGVFAIKAFPAVLIPAMAAVIYYARTNKTEPQRYKKILAVLVSGYASLAVAVLLYEHFYRQATGLSFFTEYWQLQIVSRSIELAGKFPWPLQKIINVLYYVRVCLYYAMPWSLVGLYILWTQRRSLNLRRVWQDWSSWPLSHPAKLPLILTLAACAFILPFSYSNRLGSRFVFPALYLVSAAFIIFLTYYSPWLQKLHRKILRLGVLPVSAGFWLFCHCVYLALHLYIDHER